MNAGEIIAEFAQIYINQGGLGWKVKVQMHTNEEGEGVDIQNKTKSVEGDIYAKSQHELTGRFI